MRALVYTEPRAVELREWPDPSPATGEVLIEVRAAAICGSDLHGFLGHSRIRVPPMVMGHEFAGEIVALSPEVVDLAIGDRVVVQPLVSCGRCSQCRAGKPNICPYRRLMGGQLQGAFAERIAAPQHLVYTIPEGIGYGEAALTEPLANGVHMVHLAQAAFQDVVVIGAGTLGLMALQAFRAGGARRLVVVDTAPNRLQVAAQLGADATVNPALENVDEMVRATFDGGLPSVVVEAVGHTITRRQALGLVAPGGSVILLGLAEAVSPLDLLSAINREVRLQGSYGSDDRDFREALALIAGQRVDVSSWVQRFSLDQGQQIFTQLVEDPRNLVKAVFVRE